MPSEKYNKDVRFPPLEQLFSSIAASGAHLVVSWTWKHPEEEDWKPLPEVFFRHAVVFQQALRATGDALRRIDPSAKMRVIAEDCVEMRKYLRDIPDMMRDPAAPEIIAGRDHLSNMDGQIAFQPKSAGSPLELADAAAFAIRHYLSGHRDGAWALRHLLGREGGEDLFAQSRQTTGGTIVIQLGKPAML